MKKTCYLRDDHFMEDLKDSIGPQLTYAAMRGGVDWYEDNPHASIFEGIEAMGYLVVDKFSSPRYATDFGLRLRSKTAESDPEVRRMFEAMIQDVTALLAGLSEDVTVTQGTGDSMYWITCMTLDPLKVSDAKKVLRVLYKEMWLPESMRFGRYHGPDAPR